MKRTKKLDKLAVEYITSVLYYRLYDCCDSMRESDKLEQRFLALCGDKYEIDQYVYEFFTKEYVDAIFKVAEENGEEVTKESFREYLDGTPTHFPENIKVYFEKP
jgi:hypothetical protein